MRPLCTTNLINIPQSHTIAVDLDSGVALVDTHSTLAERI